MTDHRHQWRLASLSLPEQPLCRKCVRCGLIEFLKSGEWTLLKKKNFPTALNVREERTASHSTADRPGEQNSGAPLDCGAPLQQETASLPHGEANSH